MTKNALYDKYKGCINCPYEHECVILTASAGYTYDDEYGVCPDELLIKEVLTWAK
jgi:hypothetical protein